MTKQTPNSKQEQIFQIQKIYIKNASLESPLSPKIFTENFKPSLKVDLNINSSVLENNTYQVILRVTTTTNVNDKVAFLCEIEQAGIFSIQNFGNEDIAYILGAKCPNILFPYARESISDLVTRSGFPPLLLEPTNFESIYTDNLQRMKQPTQ